MKNVFVATVLLVLCVSPLSAGQDLAQAVSEDYETSLADLDAAEAGGPQVPSHHSPFFKIEPEPSITMGVQAMTVAVLELLGTD